LGLKAIAMYRDGSKLSQPLNSAGTAEEDEEEPEVVGIKPAAETVAAAPALAGPTTTRKKLPDERQSLTHKFSIAGHKGYITVGLYEDGRPGEIFITMAKQGTTLSGLIDSFATAVSIALQYQVPLEVLVNKFSHVRFEPSGMTNNPNIRIAKSIVDYIFRWMGMKFLDRVAQEQIGYNNMTYGETVAEVAVDTIQEKSGVVAAVPPAEINHAIKLEIKTDEAATPFSFDVASDAPVCGACGGMTTRNGACYVCRNCGATTGCS
jgi:ribonucleoside-diphosphate reductase alpha chain